MEPYNYDVTYPDDVLSDPGGEEGDDRGGVH